MTSSTSIKCFSSFFFSFFLFYAIAPVCCSLIGNGDGADNAAMSTDDVRLFSRELIFSGPTAEESGKDDQSTRDVLLRKKRATIPDNSLVMFNPSKEYASLIDVHFVSSLRTSPSLRISCGPPKPLKGFLSLHFGLPPPFRA